MRVVGRLDVKNDYVIKGIHLEGLRKIAPPNDLAIKYYEAGIDELLFIDAVASLYDRNNLFHVIERACREVFIPITVGGGLRSIDDVRKALQAGADKVSLNSGAVRNPSLVTEASINYGAQAVVGSIEAKKNTQGWEVYVDNGRERTGKDAVEWAQELARLGAGELLITSIDQEGTKRGFDIQLIEAISSVVDLPLIVSGGMGKPEHLNFLNQFPKIKAVACASVFHYNLMTIAEVKEQLRSQGLEVRKYVTQ